MRVQEKYIRKALLLGLVVATALFQHTFSALPALFGAKAMLLIPLTVAIAIHERSMNGLFFGAFAGILWDFATVRGDGFFSVLLACVGFFCGCIVTYIMRNNLKANLILSFFSISTVNIGYWLVFVFMKGYEGAETLLFGYYLPSILYTMVFAVIYYYLVGFIHRATKSKQ